MSYETLKTYEKREYLNSSIKREKYSRKGGPLHERQIGLKTQDSIQESPTGYLNVEVKAKRTDLELLQDEREQLLAYKRRVQKEQSCIQEDEDIEPELENYDPNT